jgi:hypothetical protein
MVMKLLRVDMLQVFSILLSLIKLKSISSSAQYVTLQKCVFTSKFG